MDPMEDIARSLYAADTAAATGTMWDWNKASDEVKERYLSMARCGKQPKSPDELP